MLFGLFLIATGVKMLLDARADVDPGQESARPAVSALMPITPELHGQRFFVRLQNR